MKKVGLIGIALVTLLLVSAIPVSAVPLEKVSIKMYDEEDNLLTCPQNNTPVKMVVKFDINTTSPLPMTYQIRLSPQVYQGSYFDFSGVSIQQIKRTDLSSMTTTDVTSVASIIPPGTLNCPSDVDLCILVEEGNDEMPGKQRYEITLTNVVTPEKIANYTISIGWWNQQGSVQYGEYTKMVSICEAPVIIVPPEPKVVPCSCEIEHFTGEIDCGCTYKYFYEEDKWLKAVPEGCFKEIAPYKEGFEFLGWKKFINGELVDFIDVDSASEVNSGVCERESNTLDTYYYDDFTAGELGWTSDGQWGYGEPLQLLKFCDRVVVDKDYVWGLGIQNEHLDSNYTKTPSPANLTKSFDFNCSYNGTVYVTFTYAGHLEDGDQVIVEGYDGVEWQTIALLNNTTNTCSPVTVTGQFDMNKSQSWSGTKIRFRFVSDGDDSNHAGIYIYNVSVSADTNCPVCEEYQPLYYVSPCECLEGYTEIPLNGVVNVTVEAVYYDSTNDLTQTTTSSMDIIYDNTPPAIAEAASDDSYYNFYVTDTLSGVEANADDEPIKVVAGEDRYAFEHWEQNQDGYDVDYYYHVYDPANEVRSAAIHFDRIELGDYDYLYVYGGCEDCEIFYYTMCSGDWYGDWNDYSFDGCIYSAWVRVPLTNCGMLCSLGGCSGCGDHITPGCENCAQIVYEDGYGDAEYGISIDMIVYGTGIKVFLNGEDISDQVTIESDGQNATVKVPKSLVTETSELMIVATDNVGNANYATFELAPSGGTTGPVGEVWQQYDGSDGSVPDGKIETTELLKAISDWLDDELTTEDLLEVINKWLES